jgi:hypothetical protein
MHGTGTHPTASSARFGACVPAYLYAWRFI